MSESIVMNCSSFLTRVAIARKGKVEYLFVERQGQGAPTGNIYKGKICNILKGLNAAFVNIGESRNGFLPLEAHDDLYIFEETEDSAPREPLTRPTWRIGEEVLVQLTKPASESKGAKLTTDVSIPGALLVLLPVSPKRGISRRIEEPAERRRLHDAMEGAIPKGMGYIVRTAARGKKAEQLVREARYLLNQWSRVQRQAHRGKAPLLLWEELPMPMRTVRDYATDATTEIILDDEVVTKKLRVFCRTVFPDLLPKVRFWNQKTPVFSHHHIDHQVDELLAERVALPSGGYLIFEESETLSAIDVNTGGSERRSIQETIFHTNMEAAREIPRQIRIRNLAGLVVIDLIDMRNESQRRKVFDMLDKNIEEDKARIKILSISKLGLVEMSRERIEPSLRQLILEKCPCCGGSGRVKSLELIAMDMRNEFYRQVRSNPHKRFVARVSKDLFEFITSNRILQFGFLERRRTQVQPSATLKREEYEIVEPNAPVPAKSSG